MRHKTWLFGLILALVALFSSLIGALAAQGLTSTDTVEALGTSFTYQGHLSQSGSSADGSYDFRFILYDAEVEGAKIGSTLSRENVVVSEGRFTVQLDFGGSVLNGEARYLEVAVRPSTSGGNYTVLTPRQALTATPYAIFAQSAPWSGLTGVPADLSDGDDVAPSGAVMFFNLNSCPSGWNELTDAQGRYLVGLPDGGTLGATVGTALTDSENRSVGSHSHSYSDPGHSHAINDPGHFHYTASVLRRGGTWGDQNGSPAYASNSIGAYTDRRGTGIGVNPRTTGITINPTGATDGTNAPYLQLLVCEKD